MHQNQSKNLLTKDASLAELGQQLKQLLTLVYTHRKGLLLFPLIFASLGLLAGFFLESDKKRAEYIIAAEEETSAGWEGLLAQFGLDVGGSNPAGVFQGESLVRLFQTRTLVERGLLNKVYFKGDSILLAEAIFKQSELAGKKAFAEVQFQSDRSLHNSVTDSALYLVYKHVKKDMLSVNKPDKKQSFINVSCVHRDGELAILLGGTLIKTVTDYYVESLTKKARQNLDVLRLESDSVQRILNENLEISASITDLNVNPLKQSLRVSQNRAMIELQISVALYGELAKNLKLAEIGLRKQTPLIQIIETPRFPLERVGFKFWQYLIGGFVLGVGFAIYQAYMKMKSPKIVSAS
jgi:hypothetical protein